MEENKKATISVVINTYNAEIEKAKNDGKTYWIFECMKAGLKKKLWTKLIIDDFKPLKLKFNESSFIGIGNL